jgi:hypothetical protein
MEGRGVDVDSGNPFADGPVRPWCRGTLESAEPQPSRGRTPCTAVSVRGAVRRRGAECPGHPHFSWSPDGSPAISSSSPWRCSSSLTLGGAWKLNKVALRKDVLDRVTAERQYAGSVIAT